MNIITLEAGMAQLEKLICEGKSLANKNVTLFKLKYKLRDLTQNQPPQTIMQSMIEQSQ